MEKKNRSKFVSAQLFDFASAFDEAMLLPELQRPLTVFWMVGLTVPAPLLLRRFIRGSCSFERGILSPGARGGGDG